MKNIELSPTVSQLVSQVENEICKEELKKLSIVEQSKKTKTEQNNNLRVGTAFSGMGCPEYALKQLGVNHSSEFVIEWDKNCQETLVRNYNPKTVYGDITKVIPSKLSDIDLFVFGSPCQDLSTANRYRIGLNGSKSKHFFNSLDIIKEKQPKYVIFENVPGLLSSNGGEDFETVLKCFGDLGNYNISSKVINPVEIGGNTTRKRVFVVLIRKDIGITFNFPKNSGTKKCIKDCLIDGEYEYLPEENFIPWEKSIQEQRGHLRKSHRYLIPSREDRQRVYDINYSCPTIQRDGKVLINDGIGFRYLSNEELKLIQGFGEDLDMSHLSSTQIKSQLGNTMEVETMKQLLGEIVRINNLHTQNISAINNVNFTPTSKRRGRPLKKTVVSNNHINIVKKITNTPDLEYLNLTEEKFNEFKSHLDNGGTMSMTVEFYKNTIDKKNGKIKEKLVISIYDLQMLGFRDKKNGIYRVKITSQSSNQVEKVGKRHVVCTRPGGKGKFEPMFDKVHSQLGLTPTSKKLDCVIDGFFGGGGYTLKNIEKLNFKRYIINELDPLITKTFEAIKKDCSKVIELYNKLNNEYQELIPNELKNYEKEPGRGDKKLEKLRNKHIYLKRYYQDLLSKLDNHNDLDIYTVASIFIFVSQKTTSGFFKYYDNGTISKVNFNWHFTQNDKTKMIKHWSYLLNKHNVEIVNGDVFDLLQDKSIDKSNSLIYLDPPYVGVKYTYSNDVTEDFQLKLLRDTQEFQYRIYSNENCKELYELGINNHFSNVLTFDRNNKMGQPTKTNGGYEFLGWNTKEEVITSSNNLDYSPEKLVA